MIQNFRRKAFTMSKKAKEELADKARAKTQYRRDNMQVVIDLIREKRDGTIGKSQDQLTQSSVVEETTEAKD